MTNADALSLSCGCRVVPTNLSLALRMRRAKSQLDKAPLCLVGKKIALGRTKQARAKQSARATNKNVVEREEKEKKNQGHGTELRRNTFIPEPVPQLFPVLH